MGQTLQGGGVFPTANGLLAGVASIGPVAPSEGGGSQGEQTLGSRTQSNAPTSIRLPAEPGHLDR
jgi:hypothetical protein